jgi:hypothetical protein
MSRRRVLHLGPLSALFTLLLIVVPQPAHAYTQQTRVTVARGSSYCIQATAGIDHQQPGVFSGNQAWGTAYALAGDCVTGQVTQARVRLRVEHFDESRNAWEWLVVAPAAGWIDGTTGTDAWGPTGPTINVDYSPKVFGPGWYRTKVEAQTYRWNAAAGRFLWFGGTLYSGNEWVD